MSQPLSHRPLSSSAGVITTWPTRHQSKMGHDHRPGAHLQETPLLDALGRLSQSDSGWILLIAPPGLPVAEQLQARGINPARVLVVHGRKIKNWQRLPEQVALDRGRLNTLGQRAGVLTRFFEPTPAQGSAMSYGGQDVYLNH